jgi:alkanesulfonate monooxygenase SsuD/methylene tetrahydromethanopterin reductase-like flavin-dependent oxidoreductase (luciferase family)
MNVPSSKYAGNRMKTDLVINPFGASMAEILEVAQLGDRCGYHGVWTLDHFSATVFGGPWSRDPFVVLGAIGAVTKNVQLGVLVANMMNRHPVQLALAVNSLQSLAPGRVVCGLGAGASPGSRFAGEQDAIGRALGNGDYRRAYLRETIDVLRSVWLKNDMGDAGIDAAKGANFDGEHFQITDLSSVVDNHPAPAIIVGATGMQTMTVAAHHANGVNIQRSANLNAHVGGVRAIREQTGMAGEPFDISVYENFAVDHPEGADCDGLRELGIDHRTLFISAPYPLTAIERVAQS